MTALDGAFALTQVNEVAVLVAQHLDLNMPRIEHQLLDVDLARFEGALGFAGRVAQGGGQILVPVDAAHALTAAAGRGFEQNGIANLGGGMLGLFGTGDGVLGARRERNAGLFGQAAGSGFGAQGADGFRGGANEFDARVAAGLGEVGVFREEAIAGMNRFGAVRAGGGQDLVDAQVAFAGRRGAQIGGFIRVADVERGAVGVRIDGDAADVHLAQAAHDADSDLAAIGHQYFSEHEYRILAFARG